MSAVRCNTDEVAQSFFGFTREGGIIYSIEDGLVPVKTKERTNVDSNAKKDSQRDGPVQRFASSAIKHKANVLKTKEPARRRATRTIHSHIGEAFGSLVAALHRVLVLTMGFTSPLTDIKGAKDIINTVTTDKHRMVTKETCRGSPFADDIL
jgi:hypothetical protein